MKRENEKRAACKLYALFIFSSLVLYTMNTENASDINKARFWVGILYLENMIDSWVDDIDDVVQVPFAYCVHDKDLDRAGEDRKPHVHLMLAFSNTTTFNHVKKVFNLLSAPGQVCCSTCQACIDVRRSYDYLIHDTDNARKKGKYQYPAEERICGNNFDIGIFEQISALDRAALVKELCDCIIKMQFVNFADFYIYVSSFYEDIKYFMCVMSYSGLFERLTKANFLKTSVPSQVQTPAKPPLISSSGGMVTLDSDLPELPTCCPNCGCTLLIKQGKKPSGSQVWKCKECGKKFVK